MLWAPCAAHLGAGLHRNNQAVYAHEEVLGGTLRGRTYREGFRHAWSASLRSLHDVIQPTRPVETNRVRDANCACRHTVRVEQERVRGHFGVHARDLSAFYVAQHRSLVLPRGRARAVLLHDRVVELAILVEVRVHQDAVRETDFEDVPLPRISARPI